MCYWQRDTGFWSVQYPCPVRRDRGWRVRNDPAAQPLAAHFTGCFRFCDECSVLSAGMEAVGKILYLLFGNFRRLFFADLCNRGAVSSALAAAGADAAGGVFTGRSLCRCRRGTVRARRRSTRRR